MMVCYNGRNMWYGIPRSQVRLLKKVTWSWNLPEKWELDGRKGRIKIPKVKGELWKWLQSWEKAQFILRVDTDLAYFSKVYKKGGWTEVVIGWDFLVIL